MSLARRTWPLGRLDLPGPDTVAVWLSDLDRLPLVTGPAGEGRRERLARRRIQQRFVLRLLLGAFLDCPGKAVRIVRDGHGKPGLAGRPGSRGLTFNLSHSGGWLAVAVAREPIEVGVDIETERCLSRSLDLARRFYPTAEAEWLAGCEEPELSRCFIECWTAREALVKATGSGLAGVLGQIVLDPASRAVRSLPPGWDGPEQWSLKRPELPAGLIGHVAVCRPGMEVETVVLEAPGNRGPGDA